MSAVSSLTRAAMSRPTWGAWIEIEMAVIFVVSENVAPHVGRVD